MILRLAPAITLALLLGPVVAGLVGTTLPAFGWLPALGGETLSLEPWHMLFATPGLAAAIRLSLVPGFAATAASLAIVLLFCAAWHGTPLFARLQRLLSPLLSVPHVTVAFGLAFLVAPSGWIFRLLSPWATGLERPPDLAIVNDALGLALVAGLVCKEVPFLLLMAVAAIGQADAARARTLARTLGYGPVVGWLKGVAPGIYRQIRLPVFAVLAYSMSTVDVALVLAPTTPPPLAVLVVRWANDADLAMRFVAAAGAVLQLALVAGALAAWIAGERLVGSIMRWWVRGGGRGAADAWARLLAAGLIGLTMAAVLAGLAGLLVWSVAGAWRFPAALPTTWSLTVWIEQLVGIRGAALATLAIGLPASALAAALALACLEHEARHGRQPTSRALWLLYSPLLVPQVAFLFGAQVVLVMTGIDATWLAVVWSHLVFVLPYVFLSLADPFRALDRRYERAARCLGAGPGRTFWRVKLPMLLRPVLIAAAVGFAVSAGQYLATLFAGAGRIQTLTTEAVALSAGGDRRVIGAFALLQMALPCLAFLLALGVPAWRYRHRRFLQVTA